VEASLLGVDDHEAARDEQAAVCWCCLRCFPCARSAGRPTTPGDCPR
jgi:hypothetical protein